MDFQENQEKTLIKDFGIGKKVNGYFKIENINRRIKKNGEPFLTLTLMDKSGKIQAKIWNNIEYFYKLINTGKIYKINGYVNEYNNKKDVKIEKIIPVSQDDKNFNSEDFVEQASFDTEKLFDEMIKIVKSNLKNEYLIALTDLFIKKFKNQFEKHYGAQKIHHAYKGGLLEHTSSIIKLLIPIAEYYSLDQETLLIGVMFHDIGKISEFDIEPSVNTTLKGGLIGHIVLSNNIFIELKNKISDFPEDLSTKIQHLILSHHGEKEFGSPEIPKTCEALCLHIADLLDSKIRIFKKEIESTETKGIFSEYLPVLNRRILIPDKI